MKNTTIFSALHASFSFVLMLSLCAVLFTSCGKDVLINPDADTAITEDQLTLDVSILPIDDPVGRPDSDPTVVTMNPESVNIGPQALGHVSEYTSAIEGYDAIANPADEPDEDSRNDIPGGN